MLVLSRKLQQQIKIGDEITVTILRVKGNTVRIGVQAPRDVRVIRAELPKKTDEVEAQIAEEATDATSVSDAAEVAEAIVEAGSEANRVLAADVTDDSPASARAPHLPLKRIRERFGKAPLKQVVASCNTLAK